MQIFPHSYWHVTVADENVCYVIEEVPAVNTLVHLFCDVMIRVSANQRLFWKGVILDKL